MLARVAKPQPLDMRAQDFAAFALANAPATLEDILPSSEMQPVFAPRAFNMSDSHVHGTDMLFSAPPVRSPSWLWSPTSIQPRMGTVEQAPWSTWTSSVMVDSTLLTPELNKALSYTTGELLPCLQLIRSPSAVVQHSTRLIMQGLRAYPMMMLRRETPPPFIHPHWHRQSTPSLPQPISSCMSIAHVYAFRSQETRPFLWRTVQAEDERFLTEVHTLPAEGQYTIAYITISAGPCPRKTFWHASKRR